MLAIHALSGFGQSDARVSCVKFQDGTLCTAQDATTAALLFNVQIAINRAAKALGVRGELPVDGKIGPDTADLAFRVVLVAPADSIVGGLRFSDVSSNKAQFANELATNPQFYIQAFNEVAGVPNQALEPPPTAPPAIVPPPVPPTPDGSIVTAPEAPPAPAPLPAAKPSAMPVVAGVIGAGAIMITAHLLARRQPKRRRAIWTTAAAGVAAVGVTTVLVRRRRAA